MKVIQLTPKQLQVVRLVAEGLSNREIAQRLGIAPGTVKHHINGAGDRARVRSRVALSALYAAGSIADPERADDWCPPGLAGYRKGYGQLIPTERQALEILTDHPEEPTTALAGRLFVSEGTFKGHLNHIAAKFGLRDVENTRALLAIAGQLLRRSPWADTEDQNEQPVSDEVFTLVARHVATGLTDAAIAVQLIKDQSTAATYVDRAIAWAGVKGREGLAAHFVRNVLDDAGRAELRTQLPFKRNLVMVAQLPALHRRILHVLVNAPDATNAELAKMLAESERTIENCLWQACRICRIDGVHHRVQLIVAGCLRANLPASGQ